MSGRPRAQGTRHLDHRGQPEDPVVGVVGEANHEKLIHAHAIPNVAKENPSSAVPRGAPRRADGPARSRPRRTR